jgi:hypothetical protein
MQKGHCLLFFSLFFSSFSEAQIKDSIRHWTSAKPDIIIALSGHNSFIADRPQRVDGLKVGLRYMNKLGLHLAYHQQRNVLEQEILVDAGTTNEQIALQKTQFSYAAVGFSYSFSGHPRWNITIPVQTGFGFVRREVEYKDGSSEKSNPSFVPIEFDFQGDYYFFKWVGFSLGLGYRYSLFAGDVNQDIMGGKWYFGFFILPERLYNQFLDKTLWQAP